MAEAQSQDARFLEIQEKFDAIARRTDDPRTVQDMYSTWAPTFDKDMDDPEAYKGPEIIEKAVAELLPGDRSKMKAMDMASGTGLIGRVLHKLGFGEVDGNEPANGMRIQSLDKNTFFSNMYFYFLEDDQETEIPESEYDVVAVSGGFAPNHIPPSAMAELIRITKKDGFLVFLVQQEHLQPDRYDYSKNKLISEFDKLTANGHLRVIRKEPVKGYFLKKNGTLFVFQKLKKVEVKTKYW